MLQQVNKNIYLLQFVYQEKQKQKKLTRILSFLKTNELFF